MINVKNVMTPRESQRFVNKIFYSHPDLLGIDEGVDPHEIGNTVLSTAYDFVDKGKLEEKRYEVSE